MLWVALCLASSPELVWTRDLDAPSFGGGVIEDLDVGGALDVAFGTYFGDGHARALRGSDGELIWERPGAGGPIDASCVFLDGQVLIADSAYGRVFAIGGDEWTYDLPSGTDSPMAIADANGDGAPEILVGTMRVRGGPGRLVCFDPRTRETLWEAELDGHVQTGPVVHDDFVLAGTWGGDHSLQCFDLRTGERRWTFDMEGDLYHGPAVGTLDGQPSIVGTALDTRIVCLNFDGSLRWESNPHGEYLFAPVTIFDCDADGDNEVAVLGRTVRVLNGDGTNLWRGALDGFCSRGATILDLDGDDASDLLFGAGTSLMAVDGATGDTLWRFDAQVRGGPYEAIDTPVLVGNLAGDERLEAFFVCGMGTSENEGRDNYGRAYVLTLPRASGPDRRRF